MIDLKKVRFIFVCPTAEYVEQMRNLFKNDTNWDFKVGVFQYIEGYDTLVTAGNSYGIMDGGIDLAVRDYFQPGIQTQVQDAILDDYFGILPVGTTVVIQAKGKQYSQLIYAPTMRVPMDIRKTNNVFYASIATFRTVAQLETPPSGVVIPAFGALTGRMSPDEMAKQIRAGWAQSTHLFTHRTWDDVGCSETAINQNGY